MTEKFQRAFKLRLHHFTRSHRAQGGYLILPRHPRNDVQMRIEGAGVFDDGSRDPDIGQTSHQHPSAFGVSVRHHTGVDGVAADGWHAALA